MKQQIGAVTFIVRDYDEAKNWFAGTLGFAVIEDTPLSADKRWVLVAPPGGSATRLLLARSASPRQDAHIGDQTGGRVFLFLETDDFERDYRTFTARGVKFVEPPRQEAYGTVAVFEDLYGNRWDLVQPRE